MPENKHQNELHVRNAFAGKHVFVTGVTGFVGKVFLAMLIDELPEIRKVSLLVRGGKHSSALARFEEIANTSPVFRPLKKKYGAELGNFLTKKIEVLDGDVSQPMCGLSESTVARLTENLDLVIHVAGLTDFEPDPNEALAINVFGAKHAADIAARTKRARMMHVSTCFVVGNKPGQVAEELLRDVAPNGKPMNAALEVENLQRRVLEAENKSEKRMPKHLKRARIAEGLAHAEEFGFPNLYTFSKSLAERTLSARTDIALTIARPSIVECALSYPLKGWNEGLNTSAPLVWLLATPFRELPSKPDHHFDVVPVDLVCRGMIAIAAAHLENRAELVYQLASSDTNPMNIGRAIDLTSLGARKYHLRDGASKWERLLIRYTDAVAVDAESKSFFAIPRMRDFAKSLRDVVEKTDLKRVLPEAVHAVAGETLSKRQMEAHMHLTKADKALGGIERMLKLYKPFIHDNDWIYRTHNMRKLSSQISANEKSAFNFDVKSYEWRSYWLDVQWPGLAKWCLPLLDDEKIPNDAPPNPRIRLSHHDAHETHSSQPTS